MNFFYWRFDPGLPLELLNGNGMIVELFFIGWMVRYLLKETRRRKISFTRWLHRDVPPSMNFAASVVIFDCGVWLRSVIIWVWRRFDLAGDFSAMQIGMLAVGAVLIVVGSICKIRSITRPDFGNAPWLTAFGVLVLFTALSVVSR